MGRLFIEPIEVGAGQTRREAEGAAWRAIVRREIPGAEIGYNEVGAPIVTNMKGVHIGVAHCRGWVAVAISEEPCAVDIETTDRNFDNVVERIATPGEMEIPPILLWLGKETLYKYSGRKGLDFKRDLHLSYSEECLLYGSICDETPVRIDLSDDGQDFLASYILEVGTPIIKDE